MPLTDDERDNIIAETHDRVIRIDERTKWLSVLTKGAWAALCALTGWLLYLSFVIGTGGK